MSIALTAIRSAKDWLAVQDDEARYAAEDAAEAVQVAAESIAGFGMFSAPVSKADWIAASALRAAESAGWAAASYIFYYDDPAAYWAVQAGMSQKRLAEIVRQVIGKLK
jgi:hypothetical protein